MTDPCTTSITKCGGRLVAVIPREQEGAFPHDTEVELVKIETTKTVRRIE